MIAIVDYGMGNIASVRNALSLLDVDPLITSRAEDFAAATHVILPGVGSFADGMMELHRRGLTEILAHEVAEKKKPFLGICLGMQLLGARGQEGGDTEGLGDISGHVRRLAVDEAHYRVPHIGWDTVTHANVPLFAGVKADDFYFVHSYVLVPDKKDDIIGTCDYGETFAVAVQRENVFGVQFHPEKSQKGGLQLLKNFVTLC